MGKTTGIAWCDHTFNWWWGCHKVSPACKYCYAEALDHRYHAADPHWGADAPRRFFGDKHWREPLAWNAAAQKAGERRRVFCGSMMDLMEDRPDLAPHRARGFDLIRQTPWLDWLLLTKRPENWRKFLPWTKDVIEAGNTYANGMWQPWPNVWLGTTAEDQEHLELRLPHHLRAPAAVHFLSYEPALGALDLHRVNHREANLGFHYSALEQHRDGNVLEAPAVLDWVIAGCESGSHARPYQIDWFRKVRDQCAESGKAFLLKQATDEAELVPGQGIVQHIGVGPRSVVKGRVRRISLVEAPYLDGQQHLNWPRNRAGEDMCA